jgi:hypothetical protein
LKILAFLPNTAASYAISVRRASVLSRHGVTSFGSHLAVGTLAFWLTVPLAWPVEDFHLQVIQLPPQKLKQRHSKRYTPCLAHQKEDSDSMRSAVWQDLIF